MKKIDFGQTTSILANLGVIAGIGFLGLELRQNNELLRAEARASRATTSQAFFLPVLQSSSLARALASGSDVGVDSLLISFYYQYIFIGWEYSFNEFQEGTLEESALPIGAWRVAFDSMPGLRAHYETTRATFSSEFTEFFDSQVLGTE